VKILFTADLHLLRATQDRILDRLRAWIDLCRPDAVIVAGDLSSAPQADETLKNIRGCFPKGPLAVCLGNHDFWMHDSARNECHLLSAVVDRYWVPPAKSFDVVLLDVENLSLQSLTIVGGYGHYDLGFAVPDLVYDGVRVTEEDYLRGNPSTGSPMRWRDFQLMPSGLHLREVALQQVEGVKMRLSQSVDSRVIVALHTPPFEELLGVPMASDLPSNSPPSVYAFFRAYLGNRSMGAALWESRYKIVGVVCGHTHRRAGPVNLGGMIGINIGADYGDPRAALFSSDLNQFERLPDSAKT
jgi:Icc-related predicted phosphoesterase